MAEAKALFKVMSTEFDEMAARWPHDEKTIERMLGLYSSCVVAAAITNNRDAICQSIDALTRAIKESGQ